MMPVANVFSRTAAQRPAPLHTVVIALNVMKEMGACRGAIERHRYIAGGN